ncbi:YhdP family protein [Flocculibacter collagenilyticus]|uniref:YhdP family protein n=1 Tax=Flocculibacter collagenilyticus TaxID=2744479 RepID=UPI0018F41796|nr:YhdP family protein [Flocculibacter collagenilyticus]
MQRAKKACFYCFRKLWQLSAITIVTVAVLISVLKYTLPYADKYRVDLEQFIQQKYNANIRIGHLSASWEREGPAIVLQKLTLRPTEEAPLDLAIKEIRLKIDFWGSLTERKIKSSFFVLDGVIAKLDPQRLVSGKPASDETPIQEALSKLFLGQLKEFSVINSHVILTNQPQNRQTIAIEELAWRNDKNHHQGVGTFFLKGFSNNTLSFILDLYGSEADALFGELYVDASDVDVSPWLSQVVADKYRIDDSNLSFKSWARIDDGVIKRVQFELGENQLSWLAQQKRHQVNFSQGQVEWLPTESGWDLRVHQLALHTERLAWPTLNFSLRKKQQLYTGSVNNIDIERILPTVQLFYSEEALDNAISQYHPEGVISDLYFEAENVDSDSELYWKLAGKLDNVGWNNVEDIPGAQDLAGQFYADTNSAYVDINGEYNYLLTGRLFRKAIAYNKLGVTLGAHKSEQGWRVFSPQVQLVSDDISFQGEFGLDLTEPSAVLGLYGELALNDIANAKNYYPFGYMPDSTIEYLNKSLKSGKIKKAHVLWQGAFANYPYAEKDGRFLVQAEVEDGVMQFDSEWPEITELAATLRFENANMLITSRAGDLLGIELGQAVTAQIVDLYIADKLLIDIKTQADATKVVKLLQQSGLKDSVGSVFNTIIPEGIVRAHVGLDIGLEESYVDAYGDVFFDNNLINITTPALTLEQVSGKLSFFNDKLNATNLTSQWLQLPLDIKFTSQQLRDDYKVNIALSQLWPLEQVNQSFNLPMQQYLQGSVPFVANVDLSLANEKFNYVATLDADLTQVVSNLPAPYNKLADEQSQLVALVKGDDISNLITANIDQSLYFNAILPNDKPEFSRAHLILGEEDLGLPGQNFNISVNLPEVDVVPWTQLVNHLASNITTDDNSPSVLGLPERIRGKAKQLHVYGQTFNNVQFDTEQFDKFWQLNLNASETALRAEFSKDWLEQGVTVNADYLKLGEFNTTAEATADTHPPASQQEKHAAQQALMATIPPITFSCRDCRWKEYDLGKVNFALKRDKNSLSIDNLTVYRTRNSLAGRLKWQLTEQGSNTAITARLLSDDFGELLSGYQLTSSIKDSDADIRVNASWQDAPYEFAYEKLNGETVWKMGEGHLTEVSDKGARLLSILSLDSLFRKLRFDFRDVFSKGLFYNSFNGSMQVVNGVASTKDTKIDGIAADISIKGKTDLQSKEMSYDLSVAPKVTSSLPILVAFMTTNPITGLATLALDKMIESANVISEIKFKLTGTIDKPNLVEVKRFSKDVNLPKTATPKKNSKTIDDTIIDSPPLKINQ